MDIRQETYKTEFKAVLNDKFEKEAVAFLNSPIGGEVYIGIEDDGKVIGVKDPDNVQFRIAERLRDAISPSTLGLTTITTESAEGKVSDSCQYRKWDGEVLLSHKVWHVSSGMLPPGRQFRPVDSKGKDCGHVFTPDAEVHYGHSFPAAGSDVRTTQDLLRGHASDTQ